MDIQRLRQILKELNPIFWNDKLERQLQEKNYTSHTPISSALGRYMVFLENNTKEEFDDILQKVVPCDTPQKERVDNLLEELKKCLSPFDKVYDVLRKEFTSSFAEQVLLTYEDRVRNYDNLRDCSIFTEFLSILFFSFRLFCCDAASLLCNFVGQCIHLAAYQPLSVG